MIIKVNGASPLLDRQLKEEWLLSCHPIQTQIVDDFLSDLKNTFAV